MGYNDSGDWSGNATDPTQDPANTTPQTPWWKDPNSRPSYWPADKPWPPPLPPGATYGAQPGSINYPQNAPSLVPGQPLPDYYKTPVAPAITAPTTGGPGTAGPPTGRTLTPPSMLDLGGPAGLSYIPPAPTFKAPSIQDALSEPGYQFGVQEGDRGLQNWAAAKGTLNDSATDKALSDYNRNAAESNYAGVWNRAFSGYQSQIPIWQTTAAAGQHQNDMNYQHWWDQTVHGDDLLEWFASH